MKKICLFSFLVLLLLPLSACSSKSNDTDNMQKEKNIKIKIIAGSQILTATLENNVTARALIAKFPLTVHMKDLYAREMCYHFPEPLPANEAGRSSYEIGDISYWTPRNSLVIFYKQNGEVISNLQKIGKFDSSVKLFEQTGDTDVTFDLLNR